MILSGREIITRSLVRNLRHTAHQQQPCGVDLTLRQVSKWTSPATIDFDNSHRRAAKTTPLPFTTTEGNETITISPGAYLVDFNETVIIPLDCMATVFPRSSLWRSGVSITSGVVDSGYEGAMGAMLQVHNSMGVVLWKDAKLAQIVFEEMEGTVDGYQGVYQGSASSVGRNGGAK
jgi:dUTP pyrophosphatase